MMRIFKIKKEAVSICSRPASKRNNASNESDSYQVFDNCLFHLPRLFHLEESHLYSSDITHTAKTGGASNANTSH